MRYAVLAILALFASVTAVPAQEVYPARAIAMVIPFPPGGMADLAGRPLATAMERSLKQPIGVLNRPGASGAVGMQAVAVAKPDGYTILNTLISYQTIPEVDSLFGRKPAYTRDQLAPIARVATDPPVLAVAHDTPWTSVKEIVEDAKKRPGEIVFSSSGLYGPSHVPFEMFLSETGIRMRHLPMVGGPPAMNAVLAGNAKMWAAPPAMSVPHAKAGKLKVLAFFGNERHPAFRDAPTLKELGYNVEYSLWVGMFVPTATPPAVVTTLRNAVRQAMEDADFRATMTRIQMPVAYLDAPDFARHLEAEAKVLADVIRRIGKIEEKKPEVPKN